MLMMLGVFLFTKKQVGNVASKFPIRNRKKWGKPCKQLTRPTLSSIMPQWKMATIVWLYFGKGKYYWTYRFWEVIHVIHLILRFFLLGSF